MSAFKQNTADYKAINNAAFDLLKKTSQQWWEMINRSLI